MNDWLLRNTVTFKSVGKCDVYGIAKHKKTLV